MKSLTAAQILDLLHDDGETFVQYRLRRDAPIRSLIMALNSTPEQANDYKHARQILCDVLGTRRAKSAVVHIIACLSDLHPDVRAAAADALAKIRDVRAGASLLDRFCNDEEVVSVRSTAAIALGAVGYAAAIPHLTEALHDANANVRAGAAWSLGNLGAVSALEAIKSAFFHEQDGFTRQQMHGVIRILSSNVTVQENES